MATSQVYDLIPKMGSFLDVHLLLPMVNFVQEKKIYPEADAIEAKIRLLSQTNMIDYANDTYKELHKTSTVPPEMQEARNALLETLKQIEGKSQKLVTLLKDQELVKNLSQANNFNAEYLGQHHGITAADIAALYTFAKLQYECGKYEVAIEYLRHFRALNTDLQKDVQALWGKLGAEILMGNWEEAERDIAQIRDSIDDVRLAHTPLKQLHDRTWLLHWSLFVFYHIPNGTVVMLDLFIGNERFQRAIEMKAPWILRYLTVSAILTKHRLKELVKIVEQENHSYSDPITQFIRCLYVKFDFDAAEKLLGECDNVLQQDYIISGPEDLVAKGLRQEFLTNARLAICEAFCKIHSTIDIDLMAKKLQKSREESEKWIVNLIRNVKLDAKIDSAKNQVIVSSQAPSVYQQLLDKTKTMALRAGVLTSNLERVKTQPTIPLTIPATKFDEDDEEEDLDEL